MKTTILWKRLFYLNRILLLGCFLLPFVTTHCSQSKPVAESTEVTFEGDIVPAVVQSPTVNDSKKLLSEPPATNLAKTIWETITFPAYTEDVTITGLGLSYMAVELTIKLFTDQTEDFSSADLLNMASLFLFLLSLLSVLILQAISLSRVRTLLFLLLAILVMHVLVLILSILDLDSWLWGFWLANLFSIVNLVLLRQFTQVGPSLNFVNNSKIVSPQK